MPDERWEMIELLRSTRDAFERQTEVAEESLWEVVPPRGGWSLAQVAEHVTLVEVSTGKLIARKLFTEPAPEEMLAQTRGKEEALAARLPNRGDRLEAPDFVSPKGRWPNRAEMVSAFLSSREMVIAQLCDPTRALRRFAAPHPLIGPLDAHQWGIFLSLHCRRHLAQMEDILQDLTGKH
jgi:hypothetical protein